MKELDGVVVVSVVVDGWVKDAHYKYKILRKQKKILEKTEE